MKRYRVSVFKEKSVHISGCLTVYKNHYLIIDDEGKENYYPKNKTVINEL